MKSKESNHRRPKNTASSIPHVNVVDINQLLKSTGLCRKNDTINVRLLDWLRG